MRKFSSSLFIFILFSAYLFNGCSSLNEVKIAGTNFKDEIGQSQNLIFTFNKDLVSENQLDNWDSTQYIQFEPAVRGKFKWSAPNELVFSPVNGFGSATNYKAKLTDKLLSQSKTDKKYDVSSETVDFHTPYLQLIETESWWTLSKETGRQEARLKLIFNYPVTTQNVAERLKLTLADKSVSYKILPSAEGKIITLALANTGAADNNPVPLQITLDKGLKAQNTTYVTNEVLERTTSLPSPLHLEVFDIKTGFENNAAFVRVITTQEIVKESIENGFSINPAATLTSELTENGFILRGDFNETDTYALLINKTLKGVLGKTLEDETSRDLFFGKMPAGISFANKKALVHDAKRFTEYGCSDCECAESSGKNCQTLCQ